MAAEVKATQMKGDKKKVETAASVPDMPVETLHFVRERCRFLKISCEFNNQMKPFDG